MLSIHFDSTMSTFLSSLGLNHKEEQTYIKLLELGAQPVSVIARHIGVPRSTMYFILGRLQEMQLIEEFERKGMKYCKAIPANRIADVLHARERKLKHQFELLAEELPALTSLENRMGLVPTVKFFEGKDAVMKMYEEVLREKELCALFNPAFVKRIMPEYHFRIPETLSENGANVKELLVDCAEAREYRERFSSVRHQIRLLTPEVRFESDCIICKDRVYLIAYGEAQISAVEMLSQSLTATQRVLFEELWEKYESENEKTTV